MLFRKKAYLRSLLHISFKAMYTRLKKKCNKFAFGYTLMSPKACGFTHRIRADRMLGAHIFLLFGKTSKKKILRLSGLEWLGRLGVGEDTGMICMQRWRAYFTIYYTLHSFFLLCTSRSTSLAERKVSFCT